MTGEVWCSHRQTGLAAMLLLLWGMSGRPDGWCLETLPEHVIGDHLWLSARWFGMHYDIRHVFQSGQNLPFNRTANVMSHLNR
jgi:hypothetical protein